MGLMFRVGTDHGRSLMHTGTGTMIETPPVFVASELRDKPPPESFAALDVGTAESLRNGINTPAHGHRLHIYGEAKDGAYRVECTRCTNVSSMLMSDSALVPAIRACTNPQRF